MMKNKEKQKLYNKLSKHWEEKNYPIRKLRLNSYLYVEIK